MDLRRLSPSDWATWRDIRLTALASDVSAFGAKLAVEQAYDEAAWRGLLEPRWGVKVVAEVGEPVGLVAGVPHESHADVLYLYSMWVKPSFRGQGVGQALLEDVLAWAREHGWARVRLHVLRGNPVARRLYRRAGFVGDGEVMDFAVS